MNEPNGPMRDWCVSTAARGFVLLNPRASPGDVSGVSYAGSCFIRHQGINIISVEDEWHSAVFPNMKINHGFTTNRTKNCMPYIHGNHK